MLNLMVSKLYNLEISGKFPEITVLLQILFNEFTTKLIQHHVKNNRRPYHYSIE